MDQGEHELKELKVNKNILSFRFAFLEGAVAIKASPTSATKLVGQWTYFDASDAEVATGEWTATKAK